MNIFVTYRCNLACPYCFAAEMQPEFPRDMAWEDFERLLCWMAADPPPAVAFIGGEPTLHPYLPEMIERTVSAGISAILFTNGLFDSAIIGKLTPQVSNFVINCNDPALYSQRQAETFRTNLTRLRELGARITFSKNFSSSHLDYRYLLESMDRYGVRHVRYDISRPGPGGSNDHFALVETRRVLAHILEFVRECETRGVRTGLDCCVRLCDLDDSDRQYLERVSMKFGGICHPSLDVHPDLSASYCLPMRNLAVPDVTRFAGNGTLLRHFAEMARPLRYAHASPECVDCAEFQRRCQGGCMALTSRDTPLRSSPKAASGANSI